MALVLYRDASPGAATAASGVVLTRTLSLFPGNTALSGVGLTADGLGVQILEAGAYLWGIGVTATVAGAGSLTLGANGVAGSPAMPVTTAGVWSRNIEGVLMNLDGRTLEIRPTVTAVGTSITSMAAYVVSVFRIASFDID